MAETKGGGIHAGDVVINITTDTTGLEKSVNDTISKIERACAAFKSEWNANSAAPLMPNPTRPMPGEHFRFVCDKVLGAVVDELEKAIRLDFLGVNSARAIRNTVEGAVSELLARNLY